MRVPLSSVADISARIGWHGLTTADHRDEGDYLVTGTEVVSRGIDWDSCQRVERAIYDRDPRIQLAPGDLLVTKDGTIGKVGLVSDLPGLATLNSGVFRVRPNDAIDSRYLLWVLNSDLLREFQERIGGGSTISHLYQRDFKRFQVPLPPVEEQRRIADFLDEQVARIDEARAGVDRLVKGIEEQLASWVAHGFDSQTAKRGLVPLRRHLLGIGQGWSPQCDDRLPDDGEWGVLKAGCVNGGQFRPMELKALPENVQPRTEYLVKPGDLLMNRASGSVELIGSAAVVGEEVAPRSLLCDKVYRIRLADDWNAYYFAAIWTAPQIRDQIRIGTSGAEGMANSLPADWIRTIQIPNVNEADQATWLDEYGMRYRSSSEAISAADALSSLLEERKRALITAAVTGELDVTTARPIGMGKWVPNVGAGVDAPVVSQASSIGGIG